MNLKVRDHIIVGVRVKKSNDTIEVPDTIKVNCGDDIRHFNLNEKRRYTKRELIAKGLLKIDSNQKIDPLDNLVAMSELEYYRKFPLEVPKGYKIVADELIEKTLKEKIDSNEITLLDTEYYDTSSNTIKNYSLKEQVEMGSLLIDQYKKKIKSEIHSIRDKRLTGGFIFKTKTIQTDLGSQQVIEGLYLDVIANNQSYPLNFRTLENDYIVFNSNTAFLEMITKYREHKTLHFEQSHKVKDELQQAVTLLDIDKLIEIYRGE